MHQSLRTPKNISMYLSTNPSSFQTTFYKHFKCDFIHSIGHGRGTLYCVGHTEPPKSHQTLDNLLKLIELEIDPGSVESQFQCISNELSKKVKTFAAHTHASDELYCAIFSSTSAGVRGGRKVHTGVKTWIPPCNTADHHSAVQPKAPKRKRVVAAVGDAGEERDGTADGMQQATLESKSQVTRAFAVNVPVALIMLGANSVRAGYHQRAQGAGGRSRAACESIRGQRG